MAQSRGRRIRQTGMSRLATAFNSPPRAEDRLTGAHQSLNYPFWSKNTRVIRPSIPLKARSVRVVREQQLNGRSGRLEGTIHKVNMVLVNQRCRELSKKRSRDNCLSKS